MSQNPLVSQESSEGLSFDHNNRTKDVEETGHNHNLSQKSGSSFVSSSKKDLVLSTGLVTGFLR